MKTEDTNYSQGRRRRNKKQRKKKVLAMTLGLLTILLLVISGLTLTYYRQGNIEGTWRNEKSEQALQTYTLAILQETLPQADASSFTVQHQLKVTNNKAQLTAQARFDIPRLAALTLDQAYAETIKDAESKAAAQELSLEDYLVAAIGDNYEASLRSFLPSQESLEAAFHQQQEKEAQAIGATYDKETGTLSMVYFEGRVNPLLRTISISTTNPQLSSILHQEQLEVGQKLTYSCKDESLTLEGNPSQFQLEK